MTTSFDTESNTQTVASAGQTQTVASAWASSPLGQPDDEVTYGYAPEPEEGFTEATQAVAVDTDRRPVARHAVIAAALAIGIGGGAALGLSLFEYGPAQPTVTVPGTAPGHAVVITDNPAQPAPSTVNAPVPATGHVAIPPASVPGGSTAVPQPADTSVAEQQADPQGPAPEEGSVAEGQNEDPQLPPQGEGPEDPGLPPQGEGPENPPEPPPWDIDGDFKAPKPDPDPKPDVVIDDFKLPAPQPGPDPGPVFSPPLKAGS